MSLCALNNDGVTVSLSVGRENGVGRKKAISQMHAY
jgi:hypothetical protein